MHTQRLHIGLAVLLAALFSTGPAWADEHAQEALRHAQEAVDSAGDAKAVGEHAAEALKHIDAAKKSGKPLNPDTIKNLQRGEAELNSAVRNANRYNSEAATQDAKDAAGHLNKALGNK